MDICVGAVVHSDWGAGRHWSGLGGGWCGGRVGVVRLVGAECGGACVGDGNIVDGSGAFFCDGFVLAESNGSGGDWSGSVGGDAGAGLGYDGGRVDFGGGGGSYFDYGSGGGFGYSMECTSLVTLFTIRFSLISLEFRISREDY